MDIMQIANSPAMWIACAISVCFVVIQAVLFLREARGAGKEMGIREKYGKVCKNPVPFWREIDQIRQCLTNQGFWGLIAGFTVNRDDETGGTLWKRWVRFCRASLPCWASG